MDNLPTEIFVTILSYLDIKHKMGEHLDTINLLKAYPNIQINQKEWGQLFALRFPQFFNQNLYQYDVYDVYIGCIKLKPKLGQLIQFVNFHFYPKYIAPSYLIRNKLILYDAFTIALIDDADLLYGNYIEYNSDGNLIFTKLILEDLSKNLGTFIRFKSVNIIELLFSKVIKLDTYTREVKSAIFSAYLNHQIDQKTTEIIFKHYALDFVDKFTILLSIKELSNSYGCIFGTLPDQISESEIKDITKKIIGYTINNNFFDETFIPLWRKYSHLLPPKDIIEIYRSFLHDLDINMYCDYENKKDKNIIYIITEIAQHPIIRKKYITL